MTADTAEASEQIRASADAVYALITDLPRMGEWSPENNGGKWLEGAAPATVGARFKGKNAKGWRHWSTLSTVTEAVPGNRFAFRVTSGPLAVADWSFDLTADGDSTTVTQRWTDRRQSWFATVSKPIMGVSDRASHNRDGMRATLAAIKTVAER